MTNTPKPYSADGSKKDQVRTMFDQISAKYDFLNRMLSMGIDIRWRNRLVKSLGNVTQKTILDIATGTGDLAIAIEKQQPKKIYGLDLSPQMLEVAKSKNKTIEFVVGDSEQLQFEDHSIDIVTVSFGVRNFENLNKGLSEIYRVLKPGGQLAILEFGLPRNRFMKQTYLFYFTKILPKIGRIFSKDNRAYTYLPESVRSFPYGNHFLEELNKVGFKKSSFKGLTGGICYFYLSNK